MGKSLTDQQIQNLRDWVKALRSGEYSQGRKNLHHLTEDGFHKYCCLGVACEVYGFESKTRDFHASFGQILYSYNCTSESMNHLSHLTEQIWYCDIIPTKVFDEMYGLDGSVLDEVMSMNDSQGKTFEEISNYIEAVVLELYEVEL